MRRALRAAAAAVAAAVLVSVSSRAEAGPHPLFDDQGTLDWYTSLDAARAAAEAQGKLIFIEAGRRECGNCRTLVAQVLPSRSVRARIGAVAVGLADDIDASDPRVEAIFAQGLGQANMLPFAGFVTPSLRWVTGWSGWCDEGACCAHLQVAEQRLAVYRAKRAEALRTAAARNAPKPESKPVAAVPAPRAEAPPPAPPPVVVARVEPKPAAPRAPLARPEIASTEPVCDEHGHCTAPRPLPKAEPLPVDPDLSEIPAAPPPPVIAARPAPAPSARPAPRLVPAPTASPSPVLATPPPMAATARDAGASRLTRAAALLGQARVAASAQSWGEVMRVSDAAVGLPRDGDVIEIELLARRAATWSLERLQGAADAARERRFAAAIDSLGNVRREMAGRVQEIDAVRGERAVERLAAIDRGGADADAIRRKAYADFRGTRWASLFLPPVAVLPATPRTNLR
jgi:hypothetical protein